MPILCSTHLYLSSSPVNYTLRSPHLSPALVRHFPLTLPPSLTRCRLPYSGLKKTPDQSPSGGRSPAFTLAVVGGGGLPQETAAPPRASDAMKQMEGAPRSQR